MCKFEQENAAAAVAAAPFKVTWGRIDLQAFI